MSSGTAAPWPSALLEQVCRTTGASAVGRIEPLQSLWSGYGQILRFELLDAAVPSVVVKWVNPPSAGRHPRGWATNRSHERKLRSYAVELHFYDKYAARCDETCRVPRAFACQQGLESTEVGDFSLMLEDIDAAGFPVRRQRLADAELRDCLTWLARFHARFLGVKPEGLWQVGTYWHLATRPDELAAMADNELRDAAVALDAKLNGCRHQTLVHGDAKVEIFCFAARGASRTSSQLDEKARELAESEGAPAPRVAAVDFQYVGGGCGMKDVAYFLSSCLDEDECERLAERLLDVYFAELRRGLAMLPRPQRDIDELEQEWRALYPVAWADFFRFLQGWAPGHYKIHSYSRRMTKLAMQRL